VTPKHIKLHTYFNALKQIIKELVSVNEEVYKEALTYILPMKNAKKKENTPKRSLCIRFKSRPVHITSFRKRAFTKKRRGFCVRMFSFVLCASRPLPYI